MQGFKASHVFKGSSLSMIPTSTYVLTFVSNLFLTLIYRFYFVPLHGLG